MKRRFSTNYVLLSIMLDGILVILSLISSSFLRPYFNNLWFVKEIAQPLELRLEIYLIVLIVWIGVLFNSSVYDVTKNTQLFQEFSNLFFASALASLTLAGILYLTYRNISRMLFVLFIAQIILSSFVWRFVPWILIGLGIKGNLSRSVIVVGSGRVGQDIRDFTIANPQLNRHFLGFVDDAINVDIIAPIKEIKRTVLDNDVQEVFIALPRGESLKVDSIVKNLKD